MNPTNFNHVEAKGLSASNRNSITSRMSQFFGRRRDQNSFTGPSHRTSGACEVPIFMSASSERLHFNQHDVETAEVTSPVIEQNIYHARPATMPASSVYSQSPDFRAQNTFLEPVEEDFHPESSDAARDLEAGTSAVSHMTSESRLVREKRRKRRRVAESNRQKIASKKRLGVAFGVTTLAAVITCTFPTLLITLTDPRQTRHWP